MAARKPDREGNYVAPDTRHFNVCFKSGVLLNRVQRSIICCLSPKEIDWIWIVEEKRRATADEIRKLCEQSSNR